MGWQCCVGCMRQKNAYNVLGRNFQNVSAHNRAILKSILWNMLRNCRIYNSRTTGGLLWIQPSQCRIHKTNGFSSAVTFNLWGTLAFCSPAYISFADPPLHPHIILTSHPMLYNSEIFLSELEQKISLMSTNLFPNPSSWQGIKNSNTLSGFQSANEKYRPITAATGEVSAIFAGR
jgi:hypothetical protein